MSKKRKQEIVGHLSKIRRRIDQLDNDADCPCCDALSDWELQLLIALYRKGKGCVSLARFAVLECTETELLRATNAGQGFELQPFDDNRLSFVERNRLEELQSLITPAMRTR